MNFKISPMKVANIDEVYTIERSVHKSPWTKKTIIRCILAGYDCRILELNNEIVGFIISRYNNFEFHILNFCIAKSMQSKGFGTQFLQAVLDTLTKQLVDYVVLEVRPSNIAALSVYKKLGFEKNSLKKEYYKGINGSEDALVLSKKIKKQ